MLSAQTSKLICFASNYGEKESERDKERERQTEREGERGVEERVRVKDKEKRRAKKREIVGVKGEGARRQRKGERQKVK